MLNDMQLAIVSWSMTAVCAAIAAFAVVSLFRAIINTLGDYQ